MSSRWRLTMRGGQTEVSVLRVGPDRQECLSYGYVYKHRQPISRRNCAPSNRM